MAQYATGLTSVTFRKKQAEEIIELVQQAGLDGIEWGGDIHVPVGDIQRAAEIGGKTRRAGLRVLSYGSYFRGQGENFAPVLATAKALGAPMIRIWAGKKSFEESSPEEFQNLAAQIHEAAETAKQENICIAAEYHRNTATQTKEGAYELLRAVNSSNFKLYWQPNPDISMQEQLAEIDVLLPWLKTIHVFYWEKGNVRCALNEGITAWKAYMKHLARSESAHDLVLEFVKEDSIASFEKDAAVLRCLAQQ